MKKNTKMKSVRMTAASKCGIAVIGLCVAMALSYCFVDDKCDQLGQEIGKYEKTYATLDHECIRETARWNRNKTPEVLEQAERDLGMLSPLAIQIVRLDSEGNLIPNQASVARVYQGLASEGKASR